jgi:SET domain-containing protein
MNDDLYCALLGAGLTGLAKEFLPTPTWSSPMLTVKQSTNKDAGRGVFATQPIKKGTRLADYTGVMMTKKAFFKKYPTNRRFFYSLRNNVLDGHNHKSENVSHYINESHRPNVIMRNRGVYASKNIRAGGELYLSYPSFYTRDYTL